MAPKEKKKELLQSLPKEIGKINEDILEKVPTIQRKSAFLHSFLQDHVHSLSDERCKEESNERKSMYLDHLVVKNYTLKNTRKKLLSCKEKRKFNVFDVPKEQQRYELFEPLHDLWLNYIKDLIDFSKDITGKQLAQVEQNLLKADYHGAKMKVTKSQCPSLVGLEGIMIQETKNTWKVVTPQNKLKVVPKRNTVVSMAIEGYAFSIQGTNFMFKTSERCTKKFKSFIAYPL